MSCCHIYWLQLSYNLVACWVGVLTLILLLLLLLLLNKVQSPMSQWWRRTKDMGRPSPSTQKECVAYECTSHAPKIKTWTPYKFEVWFILNDSNYTIRVSKVDVDTKKPTSNNLGNAWKVFGWMNEKVSYEHAITLSQPLKHLTPPRNRYRLGEWFDADIDIVYWTHALTYIIWVQHHCSCPLILN